MPTLTEALHTYLQIDRAPQTTHQYKRVLTELITAIGPAREVSLVSYEDLLGYQAAMRTRLKPVTISGYTSIIKSFFSWCARRRYTEVSPAADLQVSKPRQDPTLSRAVPPDELARMVEYARVTSPRNYAIIMFLADTGCRVGGLCSLTRLHLHIEEGFAFVVEKGGFYHKARFGEETAIALIRWLELRPETDHDFVFTSREGGHPPLTRVSIYDIVKELSRRVHTSREWSPHAIRHAVGHAYAKAGVPASITQRKLGHKDIATTLAFYYPQDDPYLDLVSQRLALSALKTEDELRAIKPAKITPIQRSS